MPDTLTPEAVLAMPAGRGMDELVATMALGFVPGDPPDLSTIDLWIGTLIGWLQKRWGEIEIAGQADGWHVRKVVCADYSYLTVSRADTLPLALCRAVLLEVMRDGK